MKYLKKFGSFTESAAEPATRPATTPTPTIKPGTKPERRERPSPIRRDRPSVEPDPKAEKKRLKKAKSQDVANRFIELATEEGFDFKKYFPNV
jgi:hypothetical protein